MVVLSGGRAAEAATSISGIPAALTAIEVHDGTVPLKASGGPVRMRQDAPGRRERT